MNISMQDLDDNIRLISLEGRLDSNAAMEIELKFTAYAASVRKKVLVDVGKVSFLASLGIRILLSAARSQKQRGGAFLLSGAQPFMQEVIKMSGLDTHIQNVSDNGAGIILLKSL